MELKLAKEDIEAIATSVAIKLSKDIKHKPVVYNVGEVAKILKCHKNTVLNYIHNKMLVAKRNGKGFDITQENLNKYLNEEM